MPGKRVLVAVAHPDDESLWCGGYLAVRPGTHVACCCFDMRDPERTQRFFDACEVLGAVGFITAGAFHRHRVDTRVIKRFARGYDQIITHNHGGEYGHPAHRMLHEALRDAGIPMSVFNYGIEKGERLSRDIWEKKLEALRCYPEKVRINQQKKFSLRHESLLSCS